MRSIKAATIVVFLCAVHLGGCGSKKAEVKDVPDAGEVFDAWDAEPQEEAVDLKAEEEAEPTDAWGEELEEAGEIEAAVDQVTEEEEEEEGEVYVEAEEDVDAEGDVIFPDVQQDAGEVVQPEATIPAEGKLILPAGLKPQDFEVGNQFGTTAPDEQGNFTIPVLEQGITITVAVPKDWTDEENAFIAITSIVPKEDQPDPKPSLIVDSYSTAKALIYMSPFFLSPNPFIAESVMNASDGVPEVTDLSNFIYLNYPSTPYPFENGEFTDFYFAAIEKVSANLPEMLLPPVGGKVLNGNPWIGANHLDHVYQVEPTYKSSAPDKITMKTVPGVPLDSLLTMQEVDVFAEHKKWSASGASSFKIGSAAEADSQGNETSIVPDNSKFPLYETKPGSESRAVAPALSLFKYLDLIDLATKEIAGAIGLKSDAPNSLAIPDPEKDALYIIRGFTGRLSSGNDPGEFGFAWANYKTEHISAVSLNLMNAVIDAISIFIDLKKMLSGCAQKVFVKTLNKSLQTLPMITSGQEGNDSVILPLLKEIGKETVKNLFGCVKDYLKEKPLQALVTIGAKSLAKAIDFLGKASKIGSIVDRIGGLAGIPVPPVFIHTMFISPMDSILIRVGDPFSPKILTVNGTAVDDGADLDPPLIVEIGSKVIVTGKRFVLPGETSPGIYIYDEPGRVRPADEPEVTAGAGGDGNDIQTATFKIPKGLAGKLRIVIQKGASQFVKPAHMEIKPKITDVFPKYLFKNEPLPQYQTDQPGIKNVKVSGEGFVPQRHKVKINNIVLSMDQTNFVNSNTPKSSDAYFHFDASSLPYGKHVIGIDFGQAQMGGGNEYVMLVGQPAITGVIPANPYAKALSFAIDGKNFGEVLKGAEGSNLLKVEFKIEGASDWFAGAYPEKAVTLGDNGDQTARIRVAMPQYYMEPGKDVKIRITTPEGVSNEFTFKLKDEPSYPAYSRNLSPGDESSVLTLEQAFAFANSTGDTQPEGSFYNTGHWHSCDGDPPIIQCWYHCVYMITNGKVSPYDSNPNDPTYYVWNYENFVSAPPGRTGTEQCPSYTDPALPDSWEGLSAQEIYDNILLNNGNNNYAEPQLDGLVLRGPYVLLSGKAKGGGLVVEGFTDKQSNVSLGLAVTDATGDVVTIKDADGINVNELYIEGKSCNTGLRIINSRNVNISNTYIYNCDKGIYIENSSDIIIQGEIAGYGTGLEINGGENVSFLGSLGVDKREYGNQKVPAGQDIGLHLHGGAKFNRFDYLELRGNKRGVLIEDAADNVINPGIVGFYAAWEVFEGNAGNDTGIEFHSGAERNLVNGGTFVNNGIGALLKGGKGNRLSGGNYGSYSTIMNEEGEYVDVPEPNYEAGIKLQGSGETGPEDTEIGEISGYLTPFSYNKYGIHVDGVKGRTFIRGTGIYGSTLCGVLVANMSESVSIGDSSLWGNYKGLCVEDSENVSTGSNHIDGNMIDGTSIVRSHKISLEGDLVQTNKGDGIHIEESSAIAMSGLKVQYNEKNGIVIEKPPSVSKGAMTIGESPSGTQALKKRITRIDAMNPLPFDDNDAMKNYIYGNKENGVYIHSGARDVGIKFSEIAGNDAGGVRIEAAGENISVESSIIGKTVEWAPMSDNFGGVIILDSEGAVRIGGANRGNLISGNASHGVFIKDSGNVTIEGNYIGSDMSGLDANANFGDGIHIEGSHAIDIGVGGLDSANLISGNKLAGIYMDMEGMLSGNRVEGNFIGLTQKPEWVMPNEEDGVVIVNGAAILVPVVLDENFIAGNKLNGVYVKSGSGVVIAGNVIGKLQTFTGGAPNELSGIHLDDAAYAAILNNKIVYNKQDGVRIAGGSFRNFVVGNLITYHKGDGVVVSGFFSVMNSILSNSITNNTGDGITLDMGNTMIPKPIIRSIAKSSAGTRSIYGEVDFSVPDGSLVEIFIDSQNEGRAWIGSAHTVNRQFFLWNATPPPGESFDNVHFTATVTDNNGNTSEFGGYEPGAVIGCDAPEPPPFEIPILYGVMATLRDSEDVALTDINASDTSVLIEGSPVARDPDVCGGNVVYSSNEEGNFEIYLMDAETKAKTRLTMNSYNDVEPAFSPDCGKIAFASDASGKFKIYTMNKDGSNVQMITGGLEEARTPDFDWQGNKIVFARNVAGDFGIWSVGTDGNGLEEVIDLEGDDMRPKVNQQNGRILFRTCGGENCRAGVYLGAGLHYLIGSDKCVDTDPDWHTTNEGISYIVLSRKWKEGVGAPDPNQFHVILVSCSGYPYWRITPADKEDVGPSCCL